MKLSFLLLLAALPVFSAEQDYSVLPVALYTGFQHDPPAIVAHAIREEVDTILSPVGVKLQWRDLGKAGTGEMWIRLAVFRFIGTCDTTDLSVYPPYPFVLGDTHIADGIVIPFGDVYCNAIRAVLAHDLGSVQPEARDAVFGRAVGRVLAHELYHVFAKTRHHGSRGVAEPLYSAQTMMANEFRLDNSQVRQLRSAFLPALLQFRGVSPRSAPPGLSAFMSSGCLTCHGPYGEGTSSGPAIVEAARSYDAAKLAERLYDNRTPMYKRALRLGALWPALSGKQIESLAAFLRSLDPDSGRVSAVGSR